MNFRCYFLSTSRLMILSQNLNEFGRDVKAAVADIVRVVRYVFLITDYFS